MTTSKALQEDELLMMKNLQHLNNIKVSCLVFILQYNLFCGSASLGQAGQPRLLDGTWLWADEVEFAKFSLSVFKYGKLIGLDIRYNNVKLQARPMFSVQFQ